MSTWTAVLLGCALAYALKIAGYVVPHRILRAPRVMSVTALLPVALLAALVGVQTFVGSADAAETVVIDSRAVAVVVAVVALWRRVPFVFVVILGAGTSALLRAAGWS